MLNQKKRNAIHVYAETFQQKYRIIKYKDINRN